MYDFEFTRPTTFEDAARLLAENEEAKLLAGGMTLLPTLKHRLASPSKLLDLSGIPSLAGVKRHGSGLEIGAMTRHIEVVRSPDVSAVIPVLAQLAGGIGDPAVRNRGTMGGSVSNNDPAADYPSAVVGLGATLVTSKREIAADDFFTGMFSTALERDELLIAIRYPKPDKAHYKKLPNPASRYAMVGVFVAKFGNRVRVAVTGAGYCVFRLPELEEKLTNSFTADAIRDVQVADTDLLEDMHASRQYRAHLIATLACRAVAAC